ncbi:ATP-dependent helicase HepA [Sporomusa ovata DSM 2662]|uniref:COG0553: Superfamily II DNA/RNA helicases, SNF2 family n=1 Tax=Sporomusa ovata TaxID=2378 RepID=A0A0U1KYT3_9FIRM|nr:DEAD/DEAH box helicase [Sporomusa ovata]EQB29146.1 superfamily II DNA/RNA helicase, SNF2 family [Sporomusa ovata DSM 2662]CQR72578.1 COG0553: Superfamily II DNA/RNA helicases, SNF2 family [Sporomusa ovata]
MLADETIKYEADSDASYIRGCHYYHNNCVDNLHLTRQDNTFEARVRGHYFYIVTVTFNGQEKIKNYVCDCPAFHPRKGACKHVVAVLKAIQQAWSDYFGTFKSVPLTRSTQKMLDFFQNQATAGTSEKPGTSQLVKLTPTYGFQVHNTRKISYLEFTIGSDRMYVLKDIVQLLVALDTNQEIVFGKNLTLNPQDVLFDDLSARLLKMLQQAYKEEKERVFWNLPNFSGSASHSAFSDSRHFKLTNTNLLHFLTAMGSEPFTAIVNDQKITNLTINNGRPPVKLAITAINGGLSLTMNLTNDVFYGLDADFQYIFHNKAIYHVDTVFAQYIKHLLNCFSENRKPELYIPAATVSEFVSATLPALETIAAVTIDSAVHKKFHKKHLQKRVYLDKYAAGISAKIEFCYGDVVIQYNAGTTPAPTAVNDKWLLRSAIEEKILVNIFQRHGFVWAADKFILAAEEDAYTFLQQVLPELQDSAEIFYSDEFNNMKIQPPGKIAAGIRLNTATDMLEFSLDLEDISSKELIELLAAYKLKKRYHRLPAGGFIPLDSPEFQTVAGLIEELGLRPGDIEKQVVELPKYRALYLDSLARETTDFSFERNSAFKRMVQDIREPQDIEYAVPPGIQGKLRDYQKTGLKWLKSLAHYGLGGILADDMGLGKTLQVLTFILAEKEHSLAPALVIAPTSLVYNWQEEVVKFVPSLKAVVISGQPAERLEQFKAIDNADLVITSYALIKRDIEFYKKRNFSYCFLDEAQHIKNPNTLNAKSVKQIKAKSYFALTGTPIENTLTELWSIFDFLMPGYLRTHKVFTNRFEIPIVKNGDQKALQELGRHIKPFILRRMKKAVLKELPKKIESKMVNEMTADQTNLYAAWLLKARQEFETEVSTKGFEKSHIKILSLLTRLRQICCHPALFIENYQGGSGKLEMLQELLKDATDGGHRILLFSQFTGMLALIKQQLAAMKINYYYLDGATKAEDRITLVNSFNAGEKEVFLISLKAGGTGLNLTGADIVIHYDPWWNPAVEDQATDRAYRIGQKNSVQVYKLITKNTIEEKIYLLQQKKKEMIDSLIKPGENLLTKMNETEIRELFTL